MKPPLPPPTLCYMSSFSLSLLSVHWQFARKYILDIHEILWWNFTMKFVPGSFICQRCVSFSCVVGLSRTETRKKEEILSPSINVPVEEGSTWSYDNSFLCSASVEVMGPCLLIHDSHTHTAILSLSLQSFSSFFSPPAFPNLIPAKINIFF